jgi:hypothetical protein
MNKITSIFGVTEEQNCKQGEDHNCERRKNIINCLFIFSNDKNVALRQSKDGYFFKVDRSDKDFPFHLKSSGHTNEFFKYGIITAIIYIPTDSRVVVSSGNSLHLAVIDFKVDPEWSQSEWKYDSISKAKGGFYSNGNSYIVIENTIWKLVKVYNSYNSLELINTVSNNSNRF